jgi:hypothetical protein
MTRRCALFLDSEGLAAWFWRGGWLERGPDFTPDEEGFGAFQAWLATQAGTHFTLLADCVEEGFQYESIPYVVGRDRAALLSRKLAQLFYGSPYVAGLSLGRERGGRRDERMLFLALTRPAQLEPWMERLRGADVVIVGITTTALLIGATLRSLRMQPRILAVCRTATGIRQTLFEDGRLRFSRLAVLPPNGPNWTESVLFEVQKTYQYLVAQRSLARNTTLPVVVLADAAEHAALRAACGDNELFSFALLDLGERERSLGLRKPSHASDATQLLAHLAARDAGAIQLAPSRDRYSYRWWLAQRATLAVGAVGLILSMLVALRTEIDTRALEQTSDEIRLDTQARQLRYERLLSTMPRLPASVESIQGIVRELDEIAMLGRGPGPALVRISRVLTRHPEIDLQRLEWSLPDHILADVARAGPAASADKAPLIGSVAVLTARLNASTPLSQRETVEAVNQILEDMRREGAVEASVLRLPFDYGSDRTLRSAGSDSSGTEVSLRVSFPADNRS